MGIDSPKEWVVELENVQTTERGKENIFDGALRCLPSPGAGGARALHLTLDALPIISARPVRGLLPTMDICHTTHQACEARGLPRQATLDSGHVLPLNPVDPQLEEQYTYLNYTRIDAQPVMAFVFWDKDLFSSHGVRALCGQQVGSVFQEGKAGRVPAGSGISVWYSSKC